MRVFKANIICICDWKNVKGFKIHKKLNVRKYFNLQAKPHEPLLPVQWSLSFFLFLPYVLAFFLFFLFTTYTHYTYTYNYTHTYINKYLYTSQRNSSRDYRLPRAQVKVISAFHSLPRVSIYTYKCIIYSTTSCVLVRYIIHTRTIVNCPRVPPKKKKK